ncbi:YlxR family protein [Rhodococcus fascians]|nr:YlxR family protein [Rhodococcus fascians]MBY4236497.1 YlxR family protein [Rhodococcus fascians]MBY4252136.1 YlxR family protein [Rhodococcus fascians]MBY4267843.1 YlxR family protein [Rhodococcus fascians]
MTSWPIRTCVGCRERVPAADLLRIVVREAGSYEFALVPDIRHSMSGRGAWLHYNRECLHNAERRRVFGRAFRISGNVESSAVSDVLDEHERLHGENTTRATPVDKNRQQH